MKMKMKMKMKRAGAFLISAALLLGLAPTLPGIDVSAHAEIVAEPDVTAYATRQQLMSNFASDSTIGKLGFGRNSSGGRQTWYILGKDSYIPGDNIAIFAAAPWDSRLRMVIRT